MCVTFWQSDILHPPKLYIFCCRSTQCFQYDAKLRRMGLCIFILIYNFFCVACTPLPGRVKFYSIVHFYHGVYKVVNNAKLRRIGLCMGIPI
jgi:hypothetical protein